MRIIFPVTLRNHVVKIRSHQQLIQRKGTILKKFKDHTPVNFPIQDKASHCLVFFFCQVDSSSLAARAIPVKIFQIYFVYLRYIFRQFIRKFSTQGTVGNNCQYLKFKIRKRTDHTVDPARYTAYNIRVTTLCHDTYLHSALLPALSLKANNIVHFYFSIST